MLMKEVKKDLVPKWITLCYILCLGCGIMFSITDFALFGYVGMLISIYVVCRADKCDIFLFLLGTQFVRACLKVDLGFTNLSYLIFAYAIWLIRYYSHKRIKMKWMELLPFVLLIWDVIVSYAYGSIKIGDNILWTMSLLMMLFILLREKNNIDINSMVLFYCLAIWAICLINIFAEFKLYGKSLDPSMYGTYLNGSYFSFGKAYATVAGGNGIALDTILGIALCAILFIEKRAVYKKFYFVSIIFFLYCGIMCVARAFYIELVILLVMLIIIQSRKPIRLIITIGLIAIVGCLAVNVFSQYLTPIFNAVQVRFAQGNEDRNSLLDAATYILSTNNAVLLFGAGSYYPDIFLFTSHNIIYDVLMSLGIIGTCIFLIAFLVPAFRYIKQSGHFRLIGFIPIVIVITYKMISGSMRDVPLYYIVAMILLFYRKINTYAERGKMLE